MARFKDRWKSRALLILIWVFIPVLVAGMCLLMFAHQQPRSTHQAYDLTVPDFTTKPKIAWRYVIGLAEKKTETKPVAATSNKRHRLGQTENPPARKAVTHRETANNRSGEGVPQGIYDYIPSQPQETQRYNPEEGQADTVRIYTPHDTDDAGSDVAPTRPETGNSDTRKPLSETPLRVVNTPKVVLEPVELHIVPVGRPVERREFIAPATVQPLYTPSPTILPGTTHMTGSYYHH